MPAGRKACESGLLQQCSCISRCQGLGVGETASIEANKDQKMNHVKIPRRVMSFETCGHDAGCCWWLER